MNRIHSLLAAGLLLAVVALAWEVPRYLLLGWFFFLLRVLPGVAVDWASVGIGCLAVVLFTVGVHSLGRAWRRQHQTGPESRPWQFRWSVAAVVVVFLTFAAGIALVGITHQAVWLLTAEEPLVGSALKTYSSASSTNNLRRIYLGFGNYHSQFGGFPAGGRFKPDGTMLHSWETELLPYMNYKTMGIDFSRAWNHPVNQRYFRSVVPEFINPDFPIADFVDAEGYGLSHYAANSRVLAGNTALAPKDLTAGLSQTILVGEVNADVRPWGHPVNWRDPVRGINRSPEGFGGPRSAGRVNFVRADASVRWVSEQVSPEVLQALSTPVGSAWTEGKLLPGSR